MRPVLYPAAKSKVLGPLLLTGCLLVGCAGNGQPIGGADSATISSGLSGETRELTAWQSEFGISSPAEVPGAYEAPPPTPPVILTDSVPVVDGRLCGGIVNLPNSPAAVLPSGSTATAVAVCTGNGGYLAGSGVWSTVETRLVAADVVASVVAALSTPMTPFPPGDACAGVGYLFPAITVTLTDGSTVPAGVPENGCYASPDVLTLLDRVASQPPTTIERVALTRTDRELRVGCPVDAKAIYPSSGGAAVPLPVLNASAYSVCVYTTDEQSNTSLQAAGPVAATDMASLVGGLVGTPPPGCTWPTSSDTETGSFVTLVPTPAPPPAGLTEDTYPVLTIATDGCHVVVDNSWEVVGWIDDAALAGLVKGAE